MNVEIWADVACPWCYIGKRRFESALSEFDHRDQIEITWRSYQLDPSAPHKADITVNEMLAQKYHVSIAQAEAMNVKVARLASQEGLDYHMDKTKYENTFDAHRLIHLAASQNLQDAMEERLFKAYFVEGEALGDTETLVKLAGEVGLDGDTVRSTLESETFADDVQADIQRARHFGIQGVPFFAIDEKYGISGAQSSAVIKETLQQAWNEAHPLIKVTGPSEDAGYCEGDNCALPQDQ